MFHLPLFYIIIIFFFPFQASLSNAGTVAEIDSYAEDYDYSGYEEEGGEGEDFDSSMMEDGTGGPADQSKGRTTELAHKTKQL